jgi:glycosyltransferase involved in cell wall biosynthesis
MNIFIVIPFRNEKKQIEKVINGISKYNYHIVLVDDGSTDDSGFKIKDLGIKDLTLLTHKINLGKGAAMKTGSEWSFANGADAVIFMDGDNQHHPDDIPKFIKALESGKFEAVFGSRNFNYEVPLIRFLGNKFASFVLTMLFGIYISDALCGYKAFTKKAYEKIRWESTGYGVETEMIARTGKTKLSFTEVPVRAIYHDKTKGVTILDAFGIMGEIIKWRLTI